MRSPSRKNLRFFLTVGFLSQTLVACEFADHLAVKYGFGSILGIAPNAQQASMQLPTPSMRAQNTVTVPSAKKPGYGSCEPLKDKGFMQNLRSAKVWVDAIQIGRKSSSFFHTIPVNRNLNLMQLANDVSDILTQAEIPAGEYNLLRINPTEAKVTIRNGGSWPLEIRGERIEISLSRDISIESETATKKILLTFCTQRNFFSPKTGKSNPQYAFHGAIEETVNLSM